MLEKYQSKAIITFNPSRYKPFMGVSMATSEEIIASTILLARVILETEGALEEHKRGFLSGCIWMVTEANGKYNVPYWSQDVYALVQQEGGLNAVLKLRPMPIRHEHVNTRKSLVNEIMDNRNNLEIILREQAIACLVTAQEHSRLDNTNKGFARYMAAGIRVWDVKKKRWLEE